LVNLYYFYTVSHAINPLARWSKTIKRLTDAVKRFLENEDGPTTVEYSVMLALIIYLCLFAIRQVGTSSSRSFSTVNSALS